MGEFLIGIGGGFLVCLVAWVSRRGVGLGKVAPPPSPDLAKPGREVIVSHIEEEIAEVVDTVKKPKAEETLADLLNEELS